MNTLKKSVYYKVIAVLFTAWCISLQFHNKAQAQVANVTIDIPAPHGGDFGLVAGGFAFQSRTRDTEKGFKPDGNVGVSLGLGNSRKLVGVTLGANIFGLSNSVGEGDNFGSGSLDVQLNRAINDYIYIGAGARSLTNWRSPEPRARNVRSYFVTSNFIIPIHRRYDEPFSLFFITAGIGNGVFQLDRDFSLTDSGKFNVFGSMALQVFRGGNVILEWNGYEVNAGMSVYPFKKLPSLGGTFAITDITEERSRFVCSMGYSFRIVR